MSNWLPKMLLQGIEFAAVQQQPCRQFFSRLSCIPKRDLPSFPFSLYCRRSHLGLHVGGLRPGVVTLKTMQPLSLLVRIRAFLAGEVANCWSIGRSSSTRGTCWNHVEWRWFWHVLMFWQYAATPCYLSDLMSDYSINRYDNSGNRAGFIFPYPGMSARERSGVSIPCRWQWFVSSCSKIDRARRVCRSGMCHSMQWKSSR